MSSRRDALSTINLNINERPNASLWLDKFITNLSKEDKESHSTLANQVTQIKEPDNYEAIYNSWKDSLEKLGAVCRRAEVKNRIAVGLGSDGVLETSVTLHRTYGVPYIPGSALKGLAAAFAHQYCGDDWQQGKPFHEIVFGTPNAAGYVTFFDALFIPGSGHDGKALHFDVMTVHHRAYYEEKKDNHGNYLPPADWDDPNPVSFISATGKYLIALAAPEGCEAWLNVAYLILKKALEHEGVGAKTSSGYGRLDLPLSQAVGNQPVEGTNIPVAQSALVDPDERKANELIQRIKAIPVNKIPGEIALRVNDWKALQINPAQKRRVAEVILTRAREAWKERDLVQKKWYADVMSVLS